jgi:hypothetical protein
MIPDVLPLLRIYSLLCYPDSSHSWSHRKETSTLPSYPRNSTLDFNSSCLSNIYCSLI